MHVLVLSLAVLSLLLSGCTSGSGADGEGDPTASLDAMTEDVSFDETVQTTGTGVPSVQCPADDVNSQTLIWSIDAPPGAVEPVVVNMVFRVEGSASVNDVDLFVTGPDGKSIGSGTSGENTEEVRSSGEHPVGDFRIEVRGCSGTGDVHVTAEGVLRWYE